MIFRIAVSALVALLLSAPTLLHAEEHEHVARAGYIRIVHPWVRAGATGETTLAFMEFENGGVADTLESVQTEAAASARIVGVTMRNGEVAVQEIGATETPTGKFAFDPDGLAIELVGLKKTIVKGDEIEIELKFRAAGEVHLHVEVEAADAKQHSHAGHAH